MKLGQIVDARPRFKVVLIILYALSVPGDLAEATKVFAFGMSLSRLETVQHFCDIAPA